MRWSSVKTASFLVAGVLLAGGCRAPKPSGSAAPDFTLKDLAGKTVTLKSLQGHPVLLDFWATWCGPCQMSVPVLQEFYQRHEKDGLVVVGVNLDESPSDVYAFVKHFGMTYPVVYGGESSIQGDFGVEGLPTFVFVGPDGRIVDRFEGFNPALVKVWEKLLKQVLAKSH